MSGWLLLSQRQIVTGVFSFLDRPVDRQRRGALGRIKIYTIPDEGVGGEFKIASPKCLDLVWRFALARSSRLERTSSGHTSARCGTRDEESNDLIGAEVHSADELVDNSLWFAYGVPANRTYPKRHINSANCA